MDRETWLSERRKGIGSSDAYNCVFNPLAVYLDKVGLLPPIDTPETRAGLLLEGVVAACYEEREGKTLVLPPAQLYHCDKREWMLATPDRLTSDFERIVELKTAGSDRDEKGVVVWGDEGSDAIPERYLLQVQHQAAVLNLAWVDVAVLIRLGDFRVYRVQRNEQLIDLLVRFEEDLWRRVERRDPPAIGATHPDALRLLELINRPKEGIEIALPDALLVEAENYRMTGEIVRANERSRDESKARLIAAMGEAEVGILPDGRRVKRRVVPEAEVSYTRKSYTTFHITQPKREKVTQ